MGNDLPDYYESSAGVYLQPEWAAKGGTDKNLYGYITNVSIAVDTLILDYLVPTGKTLIINGYGVMVTILTGNVSGYLFDWIGAGTLAVGGGAQGFYVSLNKPVTIPAGRRARVYGAHYCAADASLHAIIVGYEL